MLHGQVGRQNKYTSSNFITITTAFHYIDWYSIIPTAWLALFFFTFPSKINSFAPCPKTIYGVCWCGMFCTALSQPLQIQEHRKDHHYNLFRNIYPFGRFSGETRVPDTDQKEDVSGLAWQTGLCANAKEELWMVFQKTFHFHELNITASWLHSHFGIYC